mmetsp:Transcript_17389/g.28571  ORF Transcript_17389/g.28571 Transcript_17389/m.28571 type:complete len:224 (+) Transcript_17389:123-794(+)
MMVCVFLLIIRVRNLDDLLDDFDIVAFITRALDDLLDDFLLFLLVVAAGGRGAHETLLLGGSLGGLGLHGAALLALGGLLELLLAVLVLADGGLKVAGELEEDHGDAHVLVGGVPGVEVLVAGDHGLDGLLHGLHLVLGLLEEETHDLLEGVSGATGLRDLAARLELTLHVEQASAHLGVLHRDRRHVLGRRLSGVDDRLWESECRGLLLLDKLADVVQDRVV